MTSEIISPFVLLFIGVGLGFLFGRIFSVTSSPFSLAFNYIFGPLLVFYGTLSKNFEFDFIIIFFAFLCLNLLLVLIAYIWSVLVPLSRKENALFRFSGTTSNIGNFGLPLCVSLFGEQTIALVAFIIVSTNFSMQLLGVFFLSNEQKSPVKALLEIFKMPMLWALLIAMFFQLAQIKLPQAVFSPIAELGRAAIPLAIFTFGVALSGLRSFSIPIRLIVQSVILRLILSPLIAIVILNLIEMEDITRKVFFVESTLPLAVFTIVLADIFDCDVEKASSMVFVSTLLSIITVPLWIHFMLPG